MGLLGTVFLVVWVNNRQSGVKFRVRGKGILKSKPKNYETLLRRLDEKTTVQK